MSVKLKMLVLVVLLGVSFLAGCGKETADGLVKENLGEIGEDRIILPSMDLLYNEELAKDYWNAYKAKNTEALERIRNDQDADTAPIGTKVYIEGKLKGTQMCKVKVITYGNGKDAEADNIHLWVKCDSFVAKDN